jgi:fumarylpyruvate hydrolase
MSFIFPPREPTSVEIKGTNDRFPVHRIYCVGRNYAAHAREMGKDPDREPPFFFTKPADAIVPNHATVPYPTRTANLHHEIELVVAIGKAGRNVPAASALDYVYGYAVGNDFTRRDLQFEARDKGRPWDTSKGFDCSAAITAITPVSACGHLSKGRIWLSVNQTLRQSGDLDELIWKVPEVIAELSTLFALVPGDLIYTGNRVEGGVEGLDVLLNDIGASEA